MLSSVADVLIISTLTVRGIGKTPLPVAVIACEFAAAIAFGLILDVAKIPVFARLGIDLTGGGFAFIWRPRRLCRPAESENLLGPFR